jgi:flagellar hook-basal body complex protein FliE
MLEGMLSNLNQTSANATDAVAGLAAGEDVDLHQVVLASEMESLSFNLALQVRNKVVEAYHEIMRMPI